MMMEEDEDIIFDQAALLPGSYSEEDHGPRHTHKTPGRILITVCLCLAFFALGLCIAIPGPTLLDLQDQTNTDTKQISRIFTGRSIGYLVGSIVGGFLFDRLNQSCLLSFSLLLTAVATAAAPWCKNYILLMAILGFQGISMGFLDTGGNVLCLYTWGRDSGPYMQAMHCLFGVGAFVAPLVAEPFLSHPFNSTNLTTDMVSLTTVEMPLDRRDIIIKRWLEDIHGPLHDPLNERQTRDTEDQDPLNEVNSSLILQQPKPTKPKVADAAHLSADPQDADASKMSHDLINMEKNQKLTPAPATTMIPTPALDDINGTSNDTGQVEVKLTTTTTTTTTTTMRTTTTTTKRTTTTETSTTPLPVGNNDTAVANDTVVGEEVPSALDTIKQQVSSIITVINDLSKVQFAYLLIAGTVLIVSVLFMIACCRGGLHLRAVKNQDMESVFGVRRENRGFRVQILILLFVFYFLYVGMEVTFGGLAMTFSVKFLGWSKSRGSLLTSVFWGAFAAARGLAIFLAKCLSPAVMLIIDLVIVIFALIGLVMAAESNNVVVWVCSAMLGIGMASIFPTGITWAERYMHVTGKATAVFVVGSALGEMLMPALAGFLFEAKGPMWLMYIMLGAAVFSIVIYIIMQNLATNMGERYNRPRNIPVSLDYSQDYVDDESEMNSLTPTNSTYSDDWSIQQRKRVTFDLNSVHGRNHHSNGDIGTGTISSSSNGDVPPRQSILKSKANGKSG